MVRNDVEEVAKGQHWIKTYNLKWGEQILSKNNGKQPEGLRAGQQHDVTYVSRNSL